MLFCANTSNCSSLSKMWKCGELCWILLDDMISEPFGDMLPLNTVVHFCQTFLEAILVRHSFERVVVWKTLSWNTLLGHWKTNSLKTPSDALFGCPLLWALSKVSGILALKIVPFQKYDPYGYSWLFTGLLWVFFALLPNLLHQNMKCLHCVYQLQNDTRIGYLWE